MGLEDNGQMNGIEVRYKRVIMNKIVLPLQNEKEKW